MDFATLLQEDMKECSKAEKYTLQQLAHLYDACHAWHLLCTAGSKLAASCRGA